MAYNFMSYQPSPNDMYRELMQAFIDEQWTNTSAKTPGNNGALQEQDGIGDPCYHCVEAWVKPTVASTSTGQKDTYDFIQVIFKNINHQSARGLYYKYCGDYWIVHDSGIFDGLPRGVGLRRCNNWLRIIDPDNGALFQVPCVVEYDMSAPSLQVSKYINTPNNHAKVLVQGNADTLRLFVYNTRYILNGRPFKLYAWQNAINGEGDDMPTYLRLDLFLDERHDGDDLPNRLADNGRFDYAITLEPDSYTLTPNATGVFSPIVTLNGNEVKRDIVWCTNPRVLEVDADGKYTVWGNAGDTTKLTARLKGNSDVSASATVTIADAALDVWSLDIDPAISVIRQYESFDIAITAYKNGVAQSDAAITVVCDSPALSIMPVKAGVWRFTGISITQAPLIVNIGVEYDGASVLSKTIGMTVVSMLGG